MAKRYDGTGHAAARTTVPREVVVQAKCRPLFNRAERHQRKRDGDRDQRNGLDRGRSVISS